MSRTAKLIFCSEDNHNKYYNMTSNGSTISVEFGRVGASCQTTSYPDSKWTSLLNSKLKKGYTEITHLFTETVSATDKVSFLDISDKVISNLIAKLEAYTKKQVSNNYLVSADSVTQKQIDEAQSILGAITTAKSNRELNQLLLEVFKTIPRKMKKVADHLYSESDDFSMSIIENVIQEEQELLDSMAQQVKQVELVSNNVSDRLTLLDAMGIEIYNVDSKQEDMIKGKLQNLSDKYVRGYKVINKKTQERFDNHIKSKSNKKVETFFHGSRNENILPILTTGLLIRPTSAIHTGSMYSDGIYGASLARKSYNYTSAKGSYWAKGNSSEAYMALFDFHVGKQLEVKKHESWCYKINEKFLQDKGGYDSIFAVKGADLINDEFVIYNPNACTIKFLIEMKG